MGRDEQLERCRAALARWRWREAYDALRAADGEHPLEPEWLDEFAAAAYLIARGVTSQSTVTARK